MSADLRTLLAAAEKLTTRLRVLQRLQKNHRDMGDTHIELALEELFEPADREALEAFEAAKAQATGQVPLPMECAS